MTENTNHSRLIRERTNEIIGNTEPAQLVQGSQKQKDWALKIRETLIDRLQCDIQDSLAAGYRATGKFENPEKTDRVKKAIDGLRAETSAPVLIDLHTKNSNDEAIVQHYAKEPVKISDTERKATEIATELTKIEDCTSLKFGSEKQQKWANDIRAEFLSRLNEFLKNYLVKMHAKNGNFEAPSIAKIKLAIEAIKSETDAKLLIDYSQRNPTDPQIINYFLLLNYSLNNNTMAPLQKDAPNHTVPEAAKLRADRLYRLIYTSSLLNRRPKTEQLQILGALQEQTSSKFWVRAYKLDNNQLISELNIK